MNAPLPPPAPIAALATRRALRVSPERRAIQVGVAGTVLVHALLLWLAPQLRLTGGGGANRSAGDAAGAAFDVQFLPSLSAPASEPPAPPPLKFVEINPAAPDNIPDQTDNTGAQNQQVAQETPTPDGRSHAPAVKGDPDRPSTAIVAGLSAEPRPLPVVAPTPITPIT